MSGFHVENFGCRAARADGEAVSSRLRSAGHSVQQLPEADVVVVNTCSVTAEADRQARAFIRRAHRLNPAAKIVVTGCYAQRAPEELAAITGVSAVVGNSHKALAPEIVSNLMGEGPYTSAQTSPLVTVTTLLAGGVPIWADDRFAHSFIEEAQLVPGLQTRPNLKIQEGCGNRCTFCVIPQTRGLSRSLPHALVMRQVRGFVAAGGNELVLSGINLGRWGRDFAGTADSDPRTLAALVREILQQTGLPRLRLSSIEPMDWNDDLIALMREFGGSRSGDLQPDGSRLARHAHLPLQSGSDAVLRRMHRRYRPWHYAQKVESLLHAAGPDLTLGADVMAGFPGETDREFEETVALIRALPFGYLHLFPFSPRPGTPGWALQKENPVPPKAVEERMALLRSLAAEKCEAHRRRFLGRTLSAITLITPPALAEQKRTSALTENFLPVEIDAPLPANQLVRLRVTSLGQNSVLNSVLDSVLEARPVA
jgi:threonylcarbamoyladenosine tRNA methylthiotransferase MtaB